MSIAYGREVIEAEITALKLVRDRLDSSFASALDRLATCQGKIVCCGMGKAGIIARKIAATLSSTGSPSFMLHPADALHGDLGMVAPGDVVLLLSNSGESDEITRLLPGLRKGGATMIAITGDERSTLAAHADVTLLLGHISEACPLGLAPTATTTAMLALGDALSMALMQRKGFQVQDYAQLHPAGTLGRKVLPVEDVMRMGEAVATVSPESTVLETILAITNARTGAAVVLDPTGHVVGVFTDGDLRRNLETGSDFLHKPVRNVMTSGGRTVTVGTLAGDVLELMRTHRIAEIPVVDHEDRLAGVADLKGLVASL